MTEVLFAKCEAPLRLLASTKDQCPSGPLHTVPWARVIRGQDIGKWLMKAERVSGVRDVRVIRITNPSRVPAWYA